MKKDIRIKISQSKDDHICIDEYWVTNDTAEIIKAIIIKNIMKDENVTIRQKITDNDFSDKPTEDNCLKPNPQPKLFRCGWCGHPTDQNGNPIDSPGTYIDSMLALGATEHIVNGTCCQDGNMTANPPPMEIAKMKE